MTTESNPVRERLLHTVKAFPGIHLRQMSREMDISEQLALYHLNLLEREGLIRSETEGIYRRFFASAAKPDSAADRDLMRLLRRQVPFQVAIFLLDRGKATQKDLTRALELSKSTVSYHVHGLLEAGFLNSEKGVLSLAEPERVRQLLQDWRPPATFLDRFELFWRRFYRPPKTK